MLKTLFVLAALALPFSSYAQQSHLEAARLAAGSTWQPAYNFFCVAPRANSAGDAPIQPTKIFDNLYAIGDSGTAAYALTTRDGIILLDSLPANQTETVLLPGMKALGLDPANVKYVVVTHGHGDHSGGSFYFQERYGAHVVLSAADWDLLQPQNGKGKASASAPRRDIVATEDQPVTLGDVKITIVMTPGHTPGSMGLIFPVKDGASTHMAAMFGGTILLPQRPDIPTLQTYLKSIQHFRAAAAQAKVGVEIQNHPLMDAIQDRLAAVRNRRAGAPHSYVAGAETYLKFLDVMAGCLRAQRADIP